MYFAQFDSPIGPLSLVSDGAALTGLRFRPAEGPEDGTGLFADAFRWLDAYFSGRDPGPAPALAPTGTIFQRKVWRELMKIPFGATVSYGALARMSGSSSARAVGQAVHNNPVAVMIPCHRVVGADGSLTGYAGGLDVKRQLLVLEESRMRLLFVMDKDDWQESGRPFSRPSARAIVVRNGKVAMVFSRKYGHYKFPGGGIRAGESREEALLREAREEAGLALDPASVRPYGFVHRIEKGDRAPVYIQENYYYLAEVSGIVPQELDEYEAEEGYTLRWVNPCEAIETNRALTNAYKIQYRTMLEREARVLEMLTAEKLL